MCGSSSKSMWDASCLPVCCSIAFPKRIPQTRSPNAGVPWPSNLAETIATFEHVHESWRALQQS